MCMVDGSGLDKDTAIDTVIFGSQTKGMKVFLTPLKVRSRPETIIDQILVQDS